MYRQWVGLLGRYDPLAVVTQVARLTYAQEARLQVLTGAAMQTRLPLALVHVLANVAHQLAAPPTAAAET